jgi:hypothetical protein
MNKNKFHHLEHNVYYVNHLLQHQTILRLHHTVYSVGVYVFRIIVRIKCDNFLKQPVGNCN